MDLKNEKQSLDRDGFCLLKNVVPKDAIETVRQNVLNTAKRMRQADAPAQIAFVPSLLRYDHSIAPYLSHSTTKRRSAATSTHLSHSTTKRRAATAVRTVDCRTPHVNTHALEAEGSQS